MLSHHAERDPVGTALAPGSAPCDGSGFLSGREAGEKQADWLIVPNFRVAKSQSRIHKSSHSIHVTDSTESLAEGRHAGPILRKVLGRDYTSPAISPESRGGGGKGLLGSL